LHLLPNKKTREFSSRARGKFLLHQQHLPRSFNGAIEPSLIMSRQAGIFAGQNAALIGHKLPEKIDILKIESISGEIHLRLGPRGSHFND